MLKLTRCVKCVLRATRSISTSGTKNQNSFRNIPSLAFGKYLLHTNIISSGVLMWLGDICQQEIEYRQGKLDKRYDYARMSRMFIVGLGLGPVHHYYYLYIAKIMPKRDLSTVFTKIGLDQFVMSPICILMFFYSTGLLEMKPVAKMNEEIVNKFMDVYLMDWCVWVPTQFINFYLIPVKYQVLYINAVTMVYNIFLSYIKHRDIERMPEKALVMLSQISDKKKVP